MSDAFSNKPVDFYGGVFSNFAASEIRLLSPVTGRIEIYPTVEHYFQASKAMTISDHDFVLGAGDAAAAKAAGRKIKLRSDWDDVRYAVMVRGLHAKFAIPMYREKLLATGSREIREDSPTDFVWGYRNGGQNLLGKALMEVRISIRESLG